MAFYLEWVKQYDYRPSLQPLASPTKPLSPPHLDFHHSYSLAQMEQHYQSRLTRNWQEGKMEWAPVCERIYQTEQCGSE